MNSSTNRYFVTSGFTLIELLTTISVAAVLMSLAAPSFVQIINSNALTSSANKFVTAINLARSEAITRNQTVIVCKRNGESCSSDNSLGWENGWIVFADSDDDGVLDSDEGIKFFEPLNRSQTLRASDENINTIEFVSNGRSDTGGFSMMLCTPNASTTDTSRSRTLNFNSAGRATLYDGAALCP